MRILVHTCCGPCLIYPHATLVSMGHSVTSYFYNPNIHPYQEYRMRLNSLKEYTTAHDIPLQYERDYHLKEFLRKVVYKESQRCKICYDLRISNTAEFAKNNGFDAFTTTLLYSKYQNHSLLISLCSHYAEIYGISFFYHDFREGWQEGIDLSIEENLYRQTYCGCIYSEQERYDNRLKKAMHKQKIQQAKTP